jgi:hypothetical protein
MKGRVQVVIDGHKYEKATNGEGKIFWLCFENGRIFDDDYVRNIIQSESDGIR